MTLQPSLFSPGFGSDCAVDWETGSVVFIGDPDFQLGEGAVYVIELELGALENILTVLGLVLTALLFVQLSITLIHTARKAIFHKQKKPKSHWVLVTTRATLRGDLRNPDNIFAVASMLYEGLALNAYALHPDIAWPPPGSCSPRHSSLC